MPSTRAAAALKHLKPPLLAATSIRCGSVFSRKPSCEVRAGQCGRSPWQGTERRWGWGEVLAGCQAVPGWGTGSSRALVSARGPLTHRNHPAAHPVGVPRASHPAVSPVGQPIASTPWHKPSCFCSAAHYDRKVDSMI